MRARLRHREAAKTLTADLFAPPHPGELRPAVVQATLPRATTSWHAVVFLDLDATRAASILQRLCLHAQQFTSLVSIEMPNALLLEIKGSVKLFGSRTALLANLGAVWHRLALPVHSATAPTPLAALWCARAGHPACIDSPAELATALADLPLDCTAWDVERLLTLRAMGVLRIGDLLRLPRAGVARRFGPATVLDLDRAMGWQATPRCAFVPRQRFREHYEFDTEVESIAGLQWALDSMIERCAGFLRERQSGVQALRLELRHRARPVTRVRIGFASVTGELHRLADVLAEKLNRVELAAPVHSVELLSGALQPLSADSLDAFVGLRGSGRDTAPQLIERLRARLGEESVYGIVPVAEHRPEAAWQRVDELPLTSQVRVGDMPRPVWLLREPVMLATERQSLQQGGLILEQGPERIESGWWDGRGIARDYYIARQSQGARCWVFQERQTHRWYLHGLFA